MTNRETLFASRFAADGRNRCRRLGLRDGPADLSAGRQPARSHSSRQARRNGSGRLHAAAYRVRRLFRLEPDQQHQQLVASEVHADRNSDADETGHDDNNDNETGYHADDDPARHHERPPARRFRQHRPFVVELQLTTHAARRL